MAIRRTTLPVMLCSLISMWGPLVPVREGLVRVMEDRAYSMEVIIFEIITNIVFVLMTAVMYLCFSPENPSVPYSVWLASYAVPYLLHLILVWFEYRRVARRRELELQGANANGGFISSALTNLAYGLEFFYLPVPIVWLKAGLNWVKSADKLLQQHALWLYWWFTRVYRASDVMFAMIWLAGITACCCLPGFIIIRRYRVQTVAKQEGAFKEDLNAPMDTSSGDWGAEHVLHEDSIAEQEGAFKEDLNAPMDTSSGDWGAEHVLREDSECDDGFDLHVTRCNHHFHVTCIQKWLEINATCPVRNCNTRLRRYSI